ncbi:hypothetical protein OG828_01430 [Streptomyces sp. NBC_00457]|uniref:hypothetical protein n=1 Tax=Streptomyces sp. NBC_00457 TaxID=2975748 RepID=UPI002E22138D
MNEVAYGTRYTERIIQETSEDMAWGDARVSGRRDRPGGHSATGNEHADSLCARQRHPSPSEDSWSTNLTGIASGTNVSDYTLYLARPRETNDYHDLDALLITNDQLNTQARNPPTQDEVSQP